MLDLELIRARLAVQCASLNAALLAADVDGVLAQAGCNPPVAFVGNYQESYDANFALSATAQSVTASFSVWLAVRRTKAATGEVWQANIATPEAEIKAALVDFEAGEAYSPLALTGGALEQITRYLAYWRLDFSTQYIHCNDL